MISKEGLEALARYAPVLEAKGFVWGKWEVPPGEIPWMRHGDVASSFMDDAYRFDWVSGHFDWPAWSKTAEAARLRADPDEIAVASADQLVKLLTCSVRSERFCEGNPRGRLRQRPPEPHRVEGSGPRGVDARMICPHVLVWTASHPKVMTLWRRTE